MVGSESDDIVLYTQRHCHFRRKSGMGTNNRTGGGRWVVDQGVNVGRMLELCDCDRTEKQYKLGSKVRPLVRQRVWPESLRNEVSSWTAPSAPDIY